MAPIGHAATTIAARIPLNAPRLPVDVRMFDPSKKVNRTTCLRLITTAAIAS
jgi:hypothetical protein